MKGLSLSECPTAKGRVIGEGATQFTHTRARSPIDEERQWVSELAYTSVTVTVL